MDKNTLYMLLGGALLAYLLGKSRGSAGKGTTLQDCVSGNSDSDIESRADKLRQIFTNEWFYNGDETPLITAQWRGLLDSCAVRKLYSYFGVLDSTLYGSGDLDYWMGKTTDACKKSCRDNGFGVVTF